ncbi:acetyl-CoA carboxylase biotin carboxyl carrier protein subunit [Emcibacter sp. SYSU 3D8]|uniref:acetyl-CoA carboxylase biotin carboxyl carrier protein subunit n=1 Tax=Emcibacter sp. SYSU 3D8 TaxID=3133969 RepID=UPI0031FEA1E0
MAQIRVESEIPGKVVSIEANPGDDVAEDDAILILESMKMEIPVAAPTSGKIVEILVAVGDTISEGDEVAIIDG